MTEQYVLQQMKSKGVSPIYYHNTDNSRLELDFVIQRNTQMAVSYTNLGLRPLYRKK